MSRIVLAGVSHRTAPVEVREGLAVAPADVPAALERLRRDTGADELVLLSTCNRVEIYSAAPAGSDIAGAALEALARSRDVDPAAIRASVYALAGREAAAHCFRVAAGLDSMLPGDAQILGQMKDAFQLAHGHGSVGPHLHRLFHQAFAVAKQVRTATGIGQGAMSAPWAAVELARKIHGPLHGTSALLIGAGAMGQLAARHLMEHGVARLLVANRTPGRAEELASSLGGTAVALADCVRHLGDVDVVVAAAGAPEPVLAAARVRAVMRQRRDRPLLVIDIAVPRTVDPTVGQVPGVFHYDVDDLERVVQANLREREREALMAERIVAREVDAHVAQLREREVAPAIVALRGKVESIRAQELARVLARLRHVSPETRQVLEAASTALVNKILHHPTVRLQAAARDEAGAQYVDSLSELFGLSLHGVTPAARAAGRQQAPA